MNGFQSGKSRNHDKPSPGCLGRMVNLFDLNSGVPGNRLLTDKPHRDGSLLRSQSDVVRLSPSEDQVEEKMIVSDLKRTSSNRKSNGTPIKLLIAQEMSKEIDSSHNPPSVVAKLMGLDALPAQKSIPAIRSHFGGHSRCHTDSSFSYCQHENESLVEEMQQEFHQYPEQNEYRDVYEVWQHSPKMNCVRSKSPQKARHNETSFEKKSAFVRQKFIEAKCLSIDEQLRQSKEFQDAIDVLSSNTDLFLKFLQEPNPKLSQHLYNLQSIPPPPETKRITVLRPSKMVDDCKFGGSVKKNEEINRATHVGKGNRAKSHMAFTPPTASWNIDENHAQPTRIVVLKPSIGKTHNFRAANSSPSASPRVSQAETSFVNMEADEAQESREVAKAITQQMRVNIGRHQRDETLVSSVFSNGYIGDESSFNKSEKECAAGNLSDSEVMSPASRHSWEYINRFGSPYSCSSMSRASYSPESSVSKEAKKRLSERWAMVASNGSCQERRPMRRSSSTLGEMLALSDIKTAGRIEQESSKEDPQIPNSNSVGNSKDDDSINKSPRNLLRSKSVPVSSTAFSAQLNVGAPDHVTGGNDLPKQTTKPRSTKSSLKGKVSNLFFSRNKKPNKDEAKCSQSNDELQTGAKPLHSLSKVDKYSSEFHDDPGVESSATDLRESSFTLTCEDVVGKQATTSPEVALSEARSLRAGHPCENQDQPSPISVLETPFEEDEHPAHISSAGIKPDRHGTELSLHPIRSNLIDKSPPIGSIARTLSWDDSCADTASSACVRPSSSTQWTEEVEREWFSFVQTLLTMAGLDEVQSDAFSTMWHSPESPLDPSLREKYIDLNEKETLHEAKRRQRRSTQKLVFDCVNAVLLDIAGYGPDNCQRARPYVGVHNNQPQGTSLILVDQVWDRMKEWFSSEVKYLSCDAEDINSLVMEGMVTKEVMGKRWLASFRLELDNLGMEIEGKLLEELVHESVIELAGRL
ncbi:uncharacterized protein LOC107780416 isoform X2 [Nicotiana tabacum]|uniref:Uncharacterized protein LOC107780416 isoform X2 n=3 Tax=Nicotiana TaxID=4085 RepID=A0A1S3YX66_TOBAC|nr:PREDICTED: uncharacterized protein LOC104221001 isoform X2 [Nicotiana sylvestris]XP_016456442.1 PREDICTED: uncharacterized protein LOC107780416 isoform X2 [Nicotiana tabacum]